MSKRAIYMGGKRTVVAVAAGPTTFGPEVASDDWWVSQYTFGGGFGDSPNFVATPSSANIGDEAAGMGGNETYAMMWDLDVAAGVTISSATVKVTTTSGGGNENAVWYIGTESGIDTSEPSTASNADSAVNRSGGSWSAAGVTPSANSTEYSIDFKDEIEAIIARGSWASGGTITLFISGPTLSSMEDATVETIAASSSAAKPNLTVVYS